MTWSKVYSEKNQFLREKSVFCIAMQPLFLLILGT